MQDAIIDNLIYDLIQYKEEAEKYKYNRFTVEYDLKKLLTRYIDDAVQEEREYWQSKLDDICDDVRGAVDNVY